jgi:hypothetical protein
MRINGSAIFDSGSFYQGVTEIGVAAVPGPVAGAGPPGLIAACGGVFGWWRRKRKVAVT